MRIAPCNIFIEARYPFFSMLDLVGQPVNLHADRVLLVQIYRTELVELAGFGIVIL
ncbi:MAG: hypothetical protein ACREQ7_07395 [Candidatus Binatia bacterium]